jgi:cadmium resistance protein CadD (predicted permease)
MLPTLEQIARAAGLAVVLFAGTNIDDVFILLALFSIPGFRGVHIVSGTLLGMAVLISLSIAGAFLALAVAPSYVGSLGLVPLGLGIWQLIRRSHGDGAAAAGVAAESGALRALAVAALTIANGGDNLGIYIPMFVTADRLTLSVYAATMLALTLALCWLARALVSHPRWGDPIRRYAEPATPYILILLGAYILITSRAYAILTG